MTITATPTPAPSVARAHVGLAVVAVIACVAQFMVVLDSSIVNVALPAMRTGLGLSVSSQQWVVNGYLITFGGLLLLASRASDLFGRRRVFLLGLVIFTVASLVGGLAQNGPMLLAARFVQGVGAAALGPASLSLITASHTEPGRRARAMTWWGVAASSAGAVGIVLGGILTATLSWRSVMLVNVPIGVGLVVATLACLRPSPASAQPNRIDAPGALTVTVSVAALVYGISIAPEHGWASGQVLASLVAGVVLFVAFVAVERRSVRPLVPLDLFAVRSLRIGNVLTACLGVVITAPLFFLSLYLQQALGQSALRAGLSLLPMAATIGVGVLLSQRLVRVVGPRNLVVLGGIVAAVGLAWLADLPDHSAYVSHLLLPTLVVAAGLSVMMMPAVIAATTGVAPANAGIASGLVNMSRQVGAAVGLAALVTIAATASEHAHLAGTAATIHGYRVALLVIAGASLLTALLGITLRSSAQKAS